jgi:hypothetical protein
VRIQQLDATQQQLDATVRQLDAAQHVRIQQLGQILRRMELTSHNALSMARNAATIDSDDALSDLWVAGDAGAPGPPQHFPANRRALETLSSADLRALLVAYGLPPNPTETRLHRLKRFIGVRL